jgi:hypothetical protein
MTRSRKGFFPMVTFSDAFPSRYLKASDLEDGPATATVKLAELTNIKGFDGRETAKVVVYFAQKFKPLPLNRTNYESLSDIAGSDETDNWPGTRVELFVTQVSMNGKVHDGVRMRSPGLPAGKKKPALVKPAADANPPEYDDEVPHLGG